MSRTLLLLVLTGCTVRGVVPPPSFGKRPSTGESVEICVPLDARAAPERRGRQAGTAAWAFGDVYEFTHHRGSLITRDRALAPTEESLRPGTSRPALILAEAVAVGLRRTGAYEQVRLGETCPASPTPPTHGTVLWSRLDYGYGAALLVSKKWRYPIATWGDRVWMDTTIENSAGPVVGYARAAVAVCTPDGCDETTVAGQSDQQSFRATVGWATRSTVNIEYGRALSDLAEEMGHTVLPEPGPQR